jgi:hypothetical protein
MITSIPQDNIERNSLKYYDTNISGYAQEIDPYDSTDFCIKTEGYPALCERINEHKVC